MLIRSVAGALLGLSIAACSSAGDFRAVPPPSGAPRVASRESGSNYQYQTIFSFQGFNGSAPAGALTYFGGKLYGTTMGGGYYSVGIVFSLTPSGSQTVLHTFGLPGDGARPAAALTVFDGVLYGTTYAGGAYGKGTVFSVTTHGDERVLYSFGKTPKDGAQPVAGLTPLNGLLYGTTSAGANYNAGTVFTMTPGGKETILHRFLPYSKKDGQNPFAKLILFNGLLYGTTEGGGKCQEGTAFSITTSGKERTLYNFPCQRYDGENPQAGVTVLDGILYGTTTQGGKAFYNDGTVYSLTTSGKERVLFDFYPPSEYGFGPNTSLVPLKGALYGTTPDDAANDAGALYSITPSGTATVVHSFGVPPDGASPLGGLTNVNGTLYGTTSSGGGVADAGTVYKVSF